MPALTAAREGDGAAARASGDGAGAAGAAPAPDAVLARARCPVTAPISLERLSSERMAAQAAFSLRPSILPRCSSVARPACPAGRGGD